MPALGVNSLMGSASIYEEGGAAWVPKAAPSRRRKPISLQVFLFLVQCSFMVPLRLPVSMSGSAPTPWPSPTAHRSP